MASKIRKSLLLKDLIILSPKYLSHLFTNTYKFPKILLGHAPSRQENSMSDYREGRSGVNVKRLVQNIAGQYPFGPQIASIIELVANALDAKASQIQIELDKNKGILEVTDNGFGMDKRQFVEYHDFAATTKERGEGIGFAGQGAKLALNFCKKVITETCSSSYRGYSEWHLSGNDAPYKIYDGRLVRLSDFGTKVSLYLDKTSTDFYDEEAIEKAITEHYFPLIHCELREKYKTIKTIKFYENGIKILLNGKEIVINIPMSELLEGAKPIIITLYHTPKALGIIGRIKIAEPLLPGIMICAYGKVIERTYFKKEPKEKEKIIGWIEAPYLIEAVTTDKCRFQKGNKTWDGFFRRAQSEFSTWLEEAGLSERPVKPKLDYINLGACPSNIFGNL
jgi:hypothetical protein